MAGVQPGFAWKLCALLGAVSLLPGCAVGPDYVRPETLPDAGYAPETITLSKAGPGEAQQFLKPAEEVSDQWWELFRSQQLSETLALAIKASPTLDIARANLAQARQAVAAARGVLYPQADAGASAAREELSIGALGGAPQFIGHLYAVGATVSYGPDVFGGVRRQIERESALAEVQRYELAAAYLTLTGNAVIEAINIAAAHEQMDAVKSIIEIDRNNLELVRIEHDAGKASAVDVLVARSQLAADRALMPSLEQQLSVANHALTVLVGKTPAQWQPPKFDLDALSLPTDLPVSLPAEFVRHRPDILASEAQLHAASAAIGVATAKLYPSLALSASWTHVTGSPELLFLQPSEPWGIAANLTAPLFHGGTLEAEKRAAIAAYSSAFGTYRLTVLQAFGQVADTLRALEHDASALNAQQEAMYTARASFELSQAGYKAGQASFLDVIVARRLYEQARIGYAKARGQRYLDTAQLFEAMGGGWRQWKDPAVGASDSAK